MTFIKKYSLNIYKALIRYTLTYDLLAWEFAAES